MYMLLCIYLKLRKYIRWPVLSDESICTGMLPSDSDDFNAVKNNGYCKQQAGEKVALQVLQPMEGQWKCQYIYISLRILTPPMETPGALKQVVLTPHGIPRGLRDICKYLNLNHGCESSALRSLEGL